MYVPSTGMVSIETVRFYKKSFQEMLPNFAFCNICNTPEHVLHVWFIRMVVDLHQHMNMRSSYTRSTGTSCFSTMEALPFANILRVEVEARSN